MNQYTHSFIRKANRLQKMKEKKSYSLVCRSVSSILYHYMCTSDEYS